MEQHLSEDLVLDVGGDGAGLGPGVLGAGLLRGAHLPHARLVTHLLLQQGVSSLCLGLSPCTLTTVGLSFVLPC